MKTMKNGIRWCMMLVAVLGLMACNEDSDRGYTLSGRWFGDLGMMVNGRPARGSDIEFIPQSRDYTAGYGTETDYYGRYGTMTVRHRFEWFVSNGVIHLRFDDPNLDCMIRNYSLSDQYFRGYMDGVYETSYFTLRSYGKYWSEYGYWREDYDYPYWDDYYVKGSGRQVSGVAGTDETPVCVRRQNLSASEE